MNAQRADTGTYKLTLTNGSGTDTAEVEVIVMCKWLSSRTFRENVETTTFLFFRYELRESSPMIHERFVKMR